MCTVLLLPGGYPAAVNKYIIIIIVRYSNSLRPRSVKMAPCCFLLCYLATVALSTESSTFCLYSTVIAATNSDLMWSLPETPSHFLRKPIGNYSVVLKPTPHFT